MRNFNAIITNPPYAGSLHLDIFDRLLDNLDGKTGQMTIVEPSTWLINVRKNGKAKKYDAIKKKIAGHVKSVKIENFNKEFNTTMFVPFSITTIDFSNTYDTIEFECCGEKKVVDSIYDCNLIGDYKTIWSILNKVLGYGDMMDKHTTNEKKGDGVWYAKYIEILGNNTIGCGLTTPQSGLTLDSTSIWSTTSNGEFVNGYITSAWHYKNNDISSIPHWRMDAGKHILCDRWENGKFIKGKVADNIYGTKEELENWKHFIFNNKLPLFINIVLTIDQNNNSKEFLPWLVDRKYTDEEIYAKFNLTEDEIALIDATLKKFERNSPWFKRYMCGEECEKTVNENRRRKNKR